MCRIVLVNMPFASHLAPSIGLTQLKSVTESHFQPGKVTIEIAYANLDFATHLGLDLYRHISHSTKALYMGLGDWVFRHAAFPELVDNTGEYLWHYVAANREQEAFIAQIVECHLPKISDYIEEVIDAYALDRADIVGMTSMFMQSTANFALARMLKERNPKVVTVVGGANCEFPMATTITAQIPAIDYVFSGPALKSFPSFVQYYLDRALSKVDEIPGVFSTNNPSSHCKRESIGEDLDINRNIALDYSDFLGRFERAVGSAQDKVVIPFETSRGCWWGERSHCTFCGLNGESMRYRAMSPELALRQFNQLFSYAGVSDILQSVDNILPKPYIERVFPLLATPKDVRIFYEVKADLDERDFAVLSSARINLVQPGIESLATSVLRLMKKGTTAYQNIRFLKLCAIYGVKPFWNLLVGFPGESMSVYSRYLEMLPLLAHLDPPNGVYNIRFDRFSPYHSRSHEYGLNLRPMDFYSFIYPFDEEAMNQFAYFFVDRDSVVSDSFAAAQRWMEPLEDVVAEWRSRWTDSPGRLSPDLYFSSGKEIVCDTRTGTLVEHRLAAEEALLLGNLSRAMRKEELERKFAAQYGIEVEPLIERLSERGMIFEEDGRLLSLVLDGPRGSLAGAQTVSASLREFMPPSDLVSSDRRLTVLQ